MARRVAVRRVPEHKFGWGECHICFIQRLSAEDVDDPKLKRVSRNKVSARFLIEPDSGDPDTRVFVEIVSRISSFSFYFGPRR